MNRTIDPRWPDGRRNDIDGLRVFATFVLFLFHAGMIFNPAPFYHIRNADVSIVFLILCGFISLWHMPLFFLLAGWSLHASVRRRGGGGVVKERLLRLGVPLVVGTIIFGPAIKYLELSSGMDLNHKGLRISEGMQASFREVIPSAIEVLPPFEESFAEFWPTFFLNAERFTWSHLWFIAYLLTFSLLYLPILRAIVLSPPQGLLRSRWWLHAPIVPLAAIQILLRPHWPGIQNLYDDWANFAFYSLFLLIGFLLAARPDIESLLHGERRRALGIGLAACGFLVLGVAGVVTSPPMILAGTAVAAWELVVALLGFARLGFRKRSARLEYLSSASFPIYLLHQPALVFIGYPLLAMSAGIETKFVLIVALAVAATLAIYHFAIRKSGILRTLFGIGHYSAGLPAAAALVVALLCISTVHADTELGGDALVGQWWADGGAAKVRIKPCGRHLCGDIEWLRSPIGVDGCPLLDAHNPAESLRERPVEGLRILTNLAPHGSRKNVWTGGRIYDPGSGNTYRCSLTVLDDERIELRGYIGIPAIGRSTTWFRVGTAKERCSAPKG